MSIEALFYRQPPEGQVFSIAVAHPQWRGVRFSLGYCHAVIADAQRLRVCGGFRRWENPALTEIHPQPYDPGELPLEQITLEAVRRETWMNEEPRVS